MTEPSPQKKNTVPRMNNPTSAKNGSLPCMTVTFAKESNVARPSRIWLYVESRQEAP